LYIAVSGDLSAISPQSIGSAGTNVTQLMIGLSSLGGESFSRINMTGNVTISGNTRIIGNLNVTGCLAVGNTIVSGVCV
jgi:hypothetical protein